MLQSTQSYGQKDVTGDEVTRRMLQRRCRKETRSQDACCGGDAGRGRAGQGRRDVVWMNTLLTLPLKNGTVLAGSSTYVAMTQYSSCRRVGCHAQVVSGMVALQLAVCCTRSRRALPRVVGTIAGCCDWGAQDDTSHAPADSLPSGCLLPRVTG